VDFMVAGWGDEGEVGKPEVFVLLFHLTGDTCQSYILVRLLHKYPGLANSTIAYGPFGILPPRAHIFNTNDKHHADVLLNRPYLCTTCSVKAPS
jgi:hypothetical protein